MVKKNADIFANFQLKELIMYFKKVFGNKKLAQFAVLALSAVFHEYALSYAFGLFFPVMFSSFVGLGGNLIAILQEHSENRVFIILSSILKY